MNRSCGTEVTKIVSSPPMKKTTPPNFATPRIDSLSNRYFPNKPEIMFVKYVVRVNINNETELFVYTIFKINVIMYEKSSF